MKRSALSLCLLLLLPSAASAAECVVLLHGLLRSSASMERLDRALQDAGFETVNVDYPSSEYRVQELAPMAVGAGVQACRERGAAPVHFVTHSLGGILLRYYLEEQPLPDMGRAVMLGPPNQGSQVVDTLRDVPGFDFFAGPAGRQLGTGEDSLPQALGPVDFPLGVIAGTSALNPFFSLMVPNPDDGSVSVASTRVEGMCSHLVLPVTHFLMMRNDEVVEQVVHYLREGRFSAEGASNRLCEKPAGAGEAGAD